ERRHVGDLSQFDRDLIAFRMGIFAGVELYHRRAEPQRGVELALVRGDEQTDADAGVHETRYDGLQVIVLRSGVEPALGGALLALLGHDAGRVRPVAQRDLDHLLRRGHLQVEWQVGGGLDAPEILVADVAPVLAQVRGDAVAANPCDDLGRAHGIGVITAARVADRGDVIDIDAQPQPSAHFLRLPGFTAGSAASSAGKSFSAYVGKLIVTNAWNGTPRSTEPPVRSTSAAAATTSPPEVSMALIASRLERPVVITSST